MIVRDLIAALAELPDYYEVEFKFEWATEWSEGADSYQVDRVGLGGVSDVVVVLRSDR